MTLLEQAMALSDQGREEEALPIFIDLAKNNDIDAALLLPGSFFSMADLSVRRGNRAENAGELVRHHQYAVKMADNAVRAALDFMRTYPHDKSSCGIVAAVIDNAFAMIYDIMAAGTTVAYNYRYTTTHHELTMRNGEVIWDEIVGQEHEEFVSLYNYSFQTTPIIGDDDKTLRVQRNRQKVMESACQVADLLEYLGRDYDAQSLRCRMAMSLADCENGDRSAMLAAEWFHCDAFEKAQRIILEAGDESGLELYDSWVDVHTQTLQGYHQLAAKYGAVMRKLKQGGTVPQIFRFYTDPSRAPLLNTCKLYMDMLQQVPQTTVKGDGWENFLTIFAQAANVKCIPMVVFASAISLLMGGLFNMFISDSVLLKVLIPVFLVITLLLTLVRSANDAANASTDRISSRNFMLIRFGMVLVFAINFWVAIVAFIVLKILSKPYR